MSGGHQGAHKVDGTSYLPGRALHRGGGGWEVEVTGIQINGMDGCVPDGMSWTGWQIFYQGDFFPTFFYRRLIGAGAPAETFGGSNAGP